MTHLKPQERLDNFKGFQEGFNEELAVQESRARIMCGASWLQACTYDMMQFNTEVPKAVTCDLCIDKRGREEALACTSICPTQGIHWGDPATFPSGDKMVL
ncbi:MAG TPA: 4Fe-4S dicluster domain-containing protein [Anaerolineae bacterium]|nr:4Fe-4S dicluster domain-containing protein [Anaerolineae bacterium]